MRRGSFWFCALINLLLNLDWSIPAWVLLALHFFLGWSIWWFVGAVVLWFGAVVLWTAFLSWAGACSNIKDKPKENKNPYSAGPYRPIKRDDSAEKK